MCVSWTPEHLNEEILGGILDWVLSKCTDQWLSTLKPYAARQDHIEKGENHHWRQQSKRRGIREAHM